MLAIKEELQQVNKSIRLILNQLKDPEVDINFIKVKRFSLSLFNFMY